MMASFVHLHVHTAYSLAEGALKLPDLMKAVAAGNMPAVAMTDTNNMFGALEFSIACANQGIQPIIGLQINLALPKEYETNHLGKIVLLAKNEEGYKNLLKLTSLAYIEKHIGAPVHITLDHLTGHHEGLILLTGGHEGPLGYLILNHRLPQVHTLTKKLAQCFGDQVYVEIMRHGLMEQQQTEPLFLALAQEYNIPIVATNDAYFLDEKMYEAHDALLCIAEGRYVLETDRRKVTPHHWLKNAKEMEQLFHDLPEAIENTILIAKRCSFMPTPKDPMLPPFESPSGLNEEDELRAQATEGLKYRLKDIQDMNPEVDTNAYYERLEYELNVIIQMGFAGYFLIVADFIKWAKAHGIPVGPGRGSGAGSVVAWALTITDMDPLRFNLIFERFLNPERVSMPDFDVDFCQDRRDEVIDYVQQKYGVERVAQIITFGKLQARAVLRDVGRVLQVPYPVVDKISKMVPQNPANPCTLEEALTIEPQLQKQREEDAQIGHLIDIALQLEGLYRHASTHAAGLIIASQPLDETVPLYRDPKSPMLVTQFSMKYVELAGLVKFDFLGLRTLTILENAAQMARDRGASVYINKIPLDDQKTFELLNRVETMGVFQLEGQGMRDVLRKLEPDRFEEIIALVALYRPGPMDDIPRYLACKHGDQKVQYLHPLLENILKETFGVMVYQEQVMQIAQVLAGYSLGKADLLRRAMGKKIKKEMDDQREFFIQGAIQNKIESNIASQIFDQMAKFAGYGFNKSHSAPYALIAYQTAYMKANYPAEFMASSMTYEMINTDKLYEFVRELHHMGIPLLLPHINASAETFTVEKDPVTGKMGIRYALAALKNVGAQVMKEIVYDRTVTGPYKDLTDFLSRLDGKAINKRQMEALIAAGAFDSFGMERATLYASIDYLLAYAATVQAEKQSGQASLFSKGDTTGSPLKLKEEKWTTQEKLQKEYDAFGFYVKDHPLQEFEATLEKFNVVLASKLNDFTGNAAQMVGIVTDYKKKISKTGKRFAYVSLSDHSGAYEVMMFEEIFMENQDLLSSMLPLLLTVSIRRDEEGNARLTCTSLKKLTHFGGGTLEIHVDAQADVRKIQEKLSPYENGTQPVHIILYLNEGERVKISLAKKYDISPEITNSLGKIPGIRDIKRCE